MAGARWREVCWAPGAESGYEWADSALLIGVARAQVIILFTLLLVALSATARAVISVANDASRRRAWWYRCRSYVEHLVRSSFAPLSQEELRVREEAEAKAIFFWRTFFQVNVLLSPIVIIALLNSGLLTASVRGKPDLQAVAISVSYPGFLMVCMFFLTAGVFFTVFPGFRTKRMIYLFIVLAHLRCGVPFLGPWSTVAFQMYEGGFSLLQLVFYLHCPDVWFFMALNASSCAAVGTILEQKLLSEGYENGCSTNVINFYVWKFCIMNVAYFMHRHLMLSQIRCTLEATSSRKVESSVETLLHGMCDAVVRLRPDLTMKNASLQLSSLLLYTVPIAQDVKFLDFVHSDLDKERLRKELSESGESGLPGMLHISLRDSSMAPVTVQLFHTTCFDAVDSLSYIVGVREAGEVGDLGFGPRHSAACCARQLEDEDSGTRLSPDCDHRRPEELGGGAAAAAAERGQAAQRPTPQDVISELESLASLTPSALLPTATPEECRSGEVAVWLDTEKTGMPMVKCTPEFLANFGGSALAEGTPFLQWAPQKHRDTLRAHINENVSELMENGLPLRNLKIRLSPAHMTNVEVQATLRFSIDARSQSGVGRGLPLLKVALRDVSYKRRLSALTSQPRGPLTRQQSPRSPRGAVIGSGARWNNSPALKIQL